MVGPESFSAPVVLFLLPVTSFHDVKFEFVDQKQEEEQARSRAVSVT